MKNIDVKRLNVVPILGACSAICACCITQKSVAQNNKKYNVVFICADDLRPTFGCYGDKYAITPNIDRLASGSQVFSRAYCQQALSNPSRASLLTGLRPDENGADHLEKHFRTYSPDVTTLPQLFKDNGYYTVSVGKVFHIVNKVGDPVSWSEPEDRRVPREYILKKNYHPNGGKMSATECADVDDFAYPDAKIAQRGIEYIKKAKSNNTN